MRFDASQTLTMVPPAGIIIAATIVVAAGLAAYENPEVRAWIDRTRHKIAMGLHNLGDEINPKQRPRTHRPSTDASMHEEKGDLAEARRMEAIAEIMERGRIMEERRKRRKLSTEKSRKSSFDTLVDENGNLIEQTTTPQPETEAHSSAVDPSGQHETLRQRRQSGQMQEESPALHESVDQSLPLRHLPPRPLDQEENTTFESRYEREMRQAWNIPLSDRRIELPSSHPSESLLDLTPSTEDAPDPDYSVPSREYLNHRFDRPEYFSVAASHSSHTRSDHESQSQFPAQSTYLNRPSTTTEQLTPNATNPSSRAPTVDGSISSIHASEAEDSADDMLSEIGDGVRTPASVWTEVDSTVSGDGF